MGKCRFGASPFLDYGCVMDVEISPYAKVLLVTFILMIVLTVIYSLLSPFFQFLGL